MASFPSLRPDVTVLITLLDDPRVVRTLDSLRQQTLPPREILVADGGSTDANLQGVRAQADRDPRIRILQLPGSVAATRNEAFPLAKGSIIAFLDSDEVAPPGWLEALVGPIARGEADFTGGPTKPLAEPASRTEAYVNRHDDWYYANAVAYDPALMPMGNAAFKKEIFQRLGGFDLRLSGGGEDFDVNLRAIDAGFRGAFVPDAWVHHDQSTIRSLGKLLRKRFRYQVGAALAYRKRGQLWRRASRSARKIRGSGHPYELLVGALKPFALAKALWRSRDWKP